MFKRISKNESARENLENMNPKDLIKNYHQRTINSNQNSKEGDEHYTKKGLVLRKFADNGWSVMTECDLGKGRADLVAWIWDKNIRDYIFQIIEILFSEKLENIERKKTYYPKGIIIRKVKTSDDLSSFDI